MTQRYLLRAYTQELKDYEDYGCCSNTIFRRASPLVSGDMLFSYDPGPGHGQQQNRICADY
jgi:hypothetical protein